MRIKLLSFLLVLILGIGFVVAINLSSFPDDFVEDTMTVIGDKAQAIDTTSANNIIKALQGETIIVTDTEMTGESQNLETSSTNLYYGGALNLARKTLTESELPTVLAEGIVEDDDGKEYDYTQEIELGDSIIEYSKESGMDDPSLLIHFGTDISSPLYSYKLNFISGIDPSSSEVQGNDIEIMGKTFIIGSDSDSTTLYLYESGAEETIKEDEAVEVTFEGDEYQVKCTGVADSNIAYISVDGTAKKVEEGETYRFGELEVYVELIAFMPKEKDKSWVRLSFGSSKLKLQDGKRAYKGDIAVKGTEVKIIDDGSEIVEIIVNVTGPKSKESYIIIGENFTDPVFGNFKINFVNIIPSIDSEEREEIVISTAGDDNAIISFDSELGEAEEFNYASLTSLADNSNNIIHVVEGEAMKEDEYMVIDAGDYGRILMLETIDDNEVEFLDVLSDTIFEFKTNNDKGNKNINGQKYYIQVDNDEVILTWGDGADNNVTGDITVFPRIKLENGEWIIFAYETTINNVNGKDVLLPGKQSFGKTTTLSTSYNNYTVGNIEWVGNWSGNNYTLSATSIAEFTDSTGPIIILLEERKDNQNNGDVVIIPLDVDDEVNIDSPIMTDNDASELIKGEDSDIMTGISSYGTYITYDTTGQNSVTLSYPDEQIKANIFASEAVAKTKTTTTETNGDVSEFIIIDTEVNMFDMGKDDNLIVIGGTAVNTVAAKLLDTDFPIYGAEFTELTGVEENQALVQIFESPYNSDKKVILVAGWEGIDTQRAAKALIDGELDLAKEKVILDTSSRDVSIL